MSDEVRDTSICFARRGNYSVWGDFENISIKHIDGRIWQVGSMYGDPQAALVTWNERYAVIVGCGIVICDLQRFGERVRGGRSWEQTPVLHLLSEPEDIWWFSATEQVLQDDEFIELRLATNLTDDHVGIYSLNPATLDFKPVPRGQPLP
ncbi:hypothetical protein MF271_07095 [Deinococcus sp. KNUC1210]|uniref:hypothetical protein n=1 Tax=Deinococcus sp. KNUC1210 TaxID=2917691 RepID=UPI001EEFF0AC|nr:hypothetical protein [Deinococcus sp. KNUC1210]ULH16351.1 hypothetical protein MF271_07095 [Deinococcus sp. KNUC1210]